MHSAAFSGHLNVVQAISKYVQNVNPADIHGLTPLHYAASNGSIPVMVFLVEKSISKGQKSKLNPAADEFHKKITPLHILAQYGRGNHLHLLKYLAPKVWQFWLDIWSS